MIFYFFKRFFYSILTLLIISFFSFSLLYIFPGDPAEFILTINMGMEPSLKEIEKFKVETGLDKPLLVQYLNWLANILKGNFGTSWSTDQPVLHLISEKFILSLKLFGITFSISAILSLILGFFSALYRNSWFDHFLRLFSIFGISIPSFWLGLIFIYIFAVKLKLLPAFGCESMKNIILPVLTWSFSIVAVKSRYFRNVFLEILQKDFILFAKAKGISNLRLFSYHILKNALIPIITYLSMSINHLIIGSITVETIFAWPGLGYLLVISILNRDFPVVQALIVLSGTLIITTNFLVDMFYLWVDPRIKYKI